MAITAEGRSLTEAHRQTQIDVAGRTADDVAEIWKILDPRRIEATFPDYLDAALVVLDRDHLRSQALSAAYLEAFHEAEGLRTRELNLREAGALSRDQAMRSLFWTGPAQIRKGIAKYGRTPETAANVALGQTQRSSMRLSLQGGRQTITDTVQATRSAQGVARVTDADPCSFCAMLASRGAVYKSRATASFKPHDGCGCQPEPVYSRRDYMNPGRSQEFSDLWADTTKGYSGKAAENAFRRAYERG